MKDLRFQRLGNIKFSHKLETFEISTRDFKVMNILSIEIYELLGKDVKI